MTMLLSAERPAIMQNEEIVMLVMEESLRAKLAQFTGAELRILLDSLYDAHGGVN